MSKIGENGLDLLFRKARSHNAWRDQPLEQSTLEAIYEVVKWGPTSSNCSPARFVFCISEEAKARLASVAMEGNRAKIRTAPACVIIAYDERFHTELPRLFPHKPESEKLFADNAALAQSTAFRNSSLQGAYLIVAARVLGLDCGPMSGFDAAKLNAEFFPDGRFKSNFLCNIGHGDPKGLFPRSPRFEFDDVCQIL